MTKKPTYHLEDCKDCLHRHVCKYVDKIDSVLKKGQLPLDLTNAECHEYEPDHSLDDHNSIEELLDKVEEVSLSTEPYEINVMQFISEVLAEIESMKEMGHEASSIVLNSQTYSAITSGGENLDKLVLPYGGSIPLVVDNRVPFGAVAFLFLEGEEDIDG